MYLFPVLRQKELCKSILNAYCISIPEVFKSESSQMSTCSLSKHETFEFWDGFPSKQHWRFLQRLGYAAKQIHGCYNKNTMMKYFKVWCIYIQSISNNMFRDVVVLEYRNMKFFCYSCGILRWRSIDCRRKKNI